jgi:hypothetical protein
MNALGLGIWGPFGARHASAAGTALELESL